MYGIVCMTMFQKVNWHVGFYLKRFYSLFYLNDELWCKIEDFNQNLQFVQTIEGVKDAIQRMSSSYMFVLVGEWIMGSLFTTIVFIYLHVVNHVYIIFLTFTYCCFFKKHKCMVHMPCMVGCFYVLLISYDYIF